MHDIFELAAQALGYFYAGKAGLKTASYMLSQDRGKAFELACSVAANAEQLIAALKDDALQARFSKGDLDVSDFILLGLCVRWAYHGARPDKRLRLTSQTRQALKRLPDELLGVSLAPSPSPVVWLRILSGFEPPDGCERSKYLPNFCRLCSDAQVPPGLREHYAPQSLSSGLPVHALASCLSAAHKMTLLDACAAPGSKTLQASEKFCRVIACEKDPRRVAVLRKRCQGNQRVSVINMDAFDAFKTQKFDCILLDPTCSGSGTASIDRQLAASLKCQKPHAGLYELAAFQLKILQAALQTRCAFVSYSTCSIYDEENEDVVSAALAEFKSDYALCHAFPEWPLRGKRYSECMRGGDEMGSEGFFVAVFRLQH